MQTSDFLDGATISKYRKLGWNFRVDQWQSQNGPEFDLEFKSPRMSKWETSYGGRIAERTLLDEEAWAVAREYMDKNLCFQTEFKEKFLEFFRLNKTVDPESVLPVIEFKLKPQNV